MPKQLLFCLSLFAGTLYSQRAATVRDTLATPFLERTEFRAGYFGNFYWNPGLALGAEYLLQQKTRTKEKKRRTKIITKQWLANGTLGFSWDPRAEFGVFTNYGITWRRTNTKGKQLQVQVNPLGYYRSFLPDTYEVNGDDVRKVFLPGRSYYAPSISFGLGKRRDNKKLSGRYLNITYSIRTPYNADFLPAIAIEYGYRFKFKKKP